jgi:SecD/SecF fusion protein
MQNKGAIKLLAILLALVSLYQLSFTFFTWLERQKAEEYANGDQEKERAYLDSVANEGIYNFLWLRDYTYRECQEREINLGLDLKGGMNVVLEVSVVDLIKSLSNNSKDPTFLKAIELAHERQKNSQEDFVTLFGEAFEEIDPGARLAAIFSTRELKDRINFESTNQEVLSVIREETNSAIDNSFNVLRNRIDRFGVAQPQIQQLENQGRIMIELPGIDNPDRFRKLLQGAAKLEFWETYDNREVFQYLSEVNQRLREINMAEEELEEEEKEEITGEEPTEEITETDAVDETGMKQDTSEVDDLLAEMEEPVQDTTGEDAGIDSLLTEIEEDTTAQKQHESLEDFNKENPLWAVLRPQTTREGKLVEGATIGIAQGKDTATVMEYLRDPQIRQMFPRDLSFSWYIFPMTIEKQEYFRLVALKSSTRDREPALTGDVVTDARAEFGNNQASAEVSLSMNGEGAKTWARITKDNVGKQVAIVLDDYVYSYPVVNQEIRGGRSQITGDFDIKEAKDLANVLKSGKMRAPAVIIQEEIVGPSLGHEAINSGLSSFLIAFIFILLYMVFYYKTAGWVADLALIANIFFIFGVLASLGAVLTLPGIAGIVLTIGISVDANVLIYERIREEIKMGKGIKLAVADGYKNAYSAIIDANVTSLITAIILGYFGKGPIQGFATTLGIGIITSLFCAIFITRLIFVNFLDKNKPVSFASKFTENAFKNLNFDFLGRRKAFYVVSGLIVLIGISSLFIRGLNYGVDFKGGRSYVVRFEEPVSTLDIASSLKDYFGEPPEVKIFGDNNQVKITTKYKIDDEGEQVDKEILELLYQGLQPIFSHDVDKETFLDDYRMSSVKVGPTIADDIVVAAIFSIAFALLAVFLYIFIRFKDWRYGLGAVAALAHDSLIILGIFSILYGLMPFSLEIDSSFIAAILTVIGYSINDTVVVFDRIREYTVLHPKRERFSVLNSALNSTLSRTFSTSLSTFVVLLAIFIFGGEVIRGFVFAMVLGVIVGTYSSLFIATPIVFDTIKAISKRDEIKQRIQEKRRAKKKQKAV